MIESLARQVEQEAYLDKIEVKSKIPQDVIKSIRVEDSKKRRRAGQNYLDFKSQEQQILNSLKSITFNTTSNISNPTNNASSFGFSNGNSSANLSDPTYGGPAQQSKQANMQLQKSINCFEALQLQRQPYEDNVLREFQKSVVTKQRQTMCFDKTSQQFYILNQDGSKGEGSQNFSPSNLFYNQSQNLNQQHH